MRGVLWAALCALIVAAYVPGLGGPFQLDDYITVAADPGSRTVAAWWAGLETHVRPLLKLSFVASGGLSALTGDAATAHRLVNLFIHLGATLAFHAFARRASAMLEPQREASERNTHAFVAAAVFALHPLGTEAVSYVSARSVSLACLLSLLALLAWMRARDAVDSQRAMWVGVGLACYVAAAGARELAIVTPLAFVLLEGLRPAAAHDAERQRRLRLLGLGSIVAIVAFAAWTAQHARYGPLLDLSARILEARIDGPVLAPALGHLACVGMLACAPDIDPAPAIASAPVTLALGISLAAVAALAVRARRRYPMAVLAVAWAALWLLPLYLLPLRHDIVSERHAYPAMWSLGWGVGAVVAALSSSPLPVLRQASRALAVLVLAGLALLCAVRNSDYGSEAALWEASLRESGPRLRALNNLGTAYLVAGRWADAERVLRAAHALDPDNAIVELNLERAQRRSAI